MQKRSNIQIGFEESRTRRFDQTLDEVIHDPDEYFRKMDRKRNASAKSNKSKKSTSKSVIEENKEYEDDSWDSDFDW